MKTSPAPLISIVIPCRNEAASIRRCVESILNNDYPRELMEIHVVDGMSTDGTRELLQELASRHEVIRLLENPRMTAPAALNLGIRQARGEVILRIDAHAEFPPDYIARCLRLLETTKAGNAGGRVVNMPNGEDPWALAVAFVTGHVLGVGNSAWRVSESFGFVDTVPCGTYPRAVLESVGLFDERLTRNQDNELNARLIKSGYKIAFDPAIRIRYWNQGTLKGLLTQGFFTGMWNVYTLVLHPYTWKWRRFVPAAFVLYLAGLAASLWLPAKLAAAAALPLALYAALIASASIGQGRRSAGALRAAATFIGYHLAYGVGTHGGIVNVLTGRWREHLGRPLRRR